MDRYSVLILTNSQMFGLMLEVGASRPSSNDSSGSCSQSFLDSPVDNQLTYTVMGRQSGDPSGVQAYINRVHKHRQRCLFQVQSASTITVMEIAQ